MSNTKTPALTQAEVEAEFEKISNTLFDLCNEHGYDVTLKIARREALTMMKAGTAPIPHHDIDEVISGFRTMIENPSFSDTIKAISFNEFAAMKKHLQYIVPKKRWDSEAVPAGLLEKFVDLITVTDDAPEAADKAKAAAECFLKEIKLSIVPVYRNGASSYEYSFGWFVVSS